MDLIPHILQRWLPRRKPELDPRHRTGAWGEKQAENFLKKKGYRILGRRVRVGKRDELDLVARAGDVLVFIEVKTREYEKFGRPSDAVNRRKRHVLSRAAVRYLKAVKSPPVCFRFDIVEVIGKEDGPPPAIRHIENAFALDPRYRVP
jgi:putative endonuclease